MDSLVQIVFWEDSEGDNPIVAFLEGISDKRDQDRIARKNEKHEERTYRQFFAQGDGVIEPVKNSKEALFELKYKGKGGFNYRALCMRWGEDMLIFAMFHGSGSDGKVNRHLPLADQRARDWKNRYPKNIS